MRCKSDAGSIAVLDLKKMGNRLKAAHCGFLETSRLLFCHWLESDMDLAFALWGDPQVTKYIATREQLSRTEIQEKLEREMHSQRKYRIQYWPVFQKEGGLHIGCCGLRMYEPDKNILELGSHIRQPFWGKGFAKEASVAVMGYAFTVLSATALFSGHNPGNGASAHVLKQLGFEYTHDQFYHPTGLDHPSYLLTADRYKMIYHK